MNSEVTLSRIRNVLARLEETIIFALVERAQFAQNNLVYSKNALHVDGYNGSFLEYLLHGTEKLHATVRRYTSPDELPFFSDLPQPVLPPAATKNPLHPCNVNINEKIMDIYIHNIIPAFCRKGDDEQYGSSAVNDVAALQAISRRIHYGQFVAESKYQAASNDLQQYIDAKDEEGILAQITKPEVEAKLLQRVEKKAMTYGRVVDDTQKEDVGEYKIDPQKVVHLYRKYIIPLTKEVEVVYLLSR
jgi:chorismate mutase